MKLTKTTEYAIRVMYQLATGEEPVYSVYRLHRELQLPYKYLGRLMHRLAEARLVESIQGKQGGYRLTRRDNRIYLYEIIGAVEGLDNYQRCILGLPECSGENPCALHQHWIKMRENMQEMIYTVSLADLMDKRMKAQAQRDIEKKALRHLGTRALRKAKRHRETARQKDKERH